MTVIQIIEYQIQLNLGETIKAATLLLNEKSQTCYGPLDLISVRH